MSKALSAAQMLEREFLPLRGKLVEIAAALDRIERTGSIAHHRLELIDQALAELRNGGGDRAERLQMLFSDPYDARWRD